MGLKSDLKGRLAKHGCFSANQEYSPDVKFDKEERAHPSKNICRKNWVSLQTKRNDFNKLQKFVQNQAKKLERE